MNDLQAIRARVEATYAGEPAGRVVADVTFLMLVTTELMLALEPFAAAFAEVPEGLRSTLRMWDGEDGVLHLSATTDDMKRAAEVVARYKAENSTGGEG